MKNRVGRAIVALIFLFFFGIYFYKQLGIRKFSDDIAFFGEATGLHPQGFGTEEAAPQERHKNAAVARGRRAARRATLEDAAACSAAGQEHRSIGDEGVWNRNGADGNRAGCGGLRTGGLRRGAIGAGGCRWLAKFS